ncbi:hypothetical protein EV175_000435 [Coemansia sp. RSA 1933]|nr:hypothetical protein EV175_000435 [Coemansia sp. RSA 1933]
MFPSTGLLSKIECPFRDECNRGTLCLFKHPEATNKGKKELAENVDIGPKKTEMVELVDFSSEEITLEDAKPVAPVPPIVRAPQKVRWHDITANTKGKQTVLPAVVGQSTNPDPQRKAASSSTTAGIMSGAKKKEPPEPIRQSVGAEHNAPKTQHSSTEKEEDWRTRTLNYDPENPGYDSTTEREAVVPQLKAIVSDKIGYSRRQRALEILYDHYKKIPGIMTAMKETTPSVAAMRAVESERDVYDSSVAGTYHGKLLVCLKELKQKAQA